MVNYRSAWSTTGALTLNKAPFVASRHTFPTLPFGKRKEIIVKNKFNFFLFRNQGQLFANRHFAFWMPSKLSGETSLYFFSNSETNNNCLK